MDPTLGHRFLGVASFSSGSSATGTGDELNEDDVLWTSSDFTEQNSVQSSSATDETSKDNQNYNHRDRRASVPQNPGILAVLPEPTQHYSVFYRKSSFPSYSSTSSSSSKSIPSIPKPPQSERELASQSMPPTARKLNQSAPMNVPLLSIAMAKQRNSGFGVDEDDGDSDEEMLPPHEIVARGSRRSPKTTFSVLEGVGRTLKGRDLRQVRNAVWRQTGFLD